MIASLGTGTGAHGIGKIGVVSTKIGKIYIYLRNLLMHTVNNLLQTLNNVKSIQFVVVKQTFNIIHIMCENFKQKPSVLCKIQLI